MKRHAVGQRRRDRARVCPGVGQRRRVIDEHRRLGRRRKVANGAPDGAQVGMDDGRGGGLVRVPEYRPPDLTKRVPVPGKVPRNRLLPRWFGRSRPRRHPTTLPGRRKDDRARSRRECGATARHRSHKEHRSASARATRSTSSGGRPCRARRRGRPERVWRLPRERACRSAAPGHRAGPPASSRASSADRNPSRSSPTSTNAARRVGTTPSARPR